MTSEVSRHDVPDRQPDRQEGVGAFDSSGAARREPSDLALVQARAAATSFLRMRPLVVVPTALVQCAFIHLSGAPDGQARVLFVGLGATACAFVAESFHLARRQVSMRWLRSSLALTLASLAGGCAASGGAESPLLPLLFAPLVTAFAALGRSRYTFALAGSAAALLASFAWLSGRLPFAPLPRPVVGPMALVATAAGLFLSWIAVSAFAAAYARTAEALDRLRVLGAAEARERAHRVEAMGAIVAHELKNPLTAIKGLLQVAAETPASARDAKRMAIVLGEVERIETTLGDYLAFSRPLPALRAEQVALERLVDDVAATLEGRAAFAGVQLVRDVAPASIEGDPRRLREAVLNLAANAIEAMPRGGTLRLGVRADEAGGAVVTVADDGPGLPEGALERPFRSDKEGGSGLGLLVVQRAARSHGGRLVAARAPGGGALLTLTLPASPPPREELPQIDLDRNAERRA